MRVLIVDDEPPARRRLARMIEAIEGVEVAGEAGDGIEALERIADARPDVVLLDIRMPGLDGLSVAGASAELPPIIFTTAYDEYAVAAFEVSAVDYLLKPIKRDRLERALEKVRARGRAGLDAERIQTLLVRIAEQTASASPMRISASSSGTVRFFDPAEITRFHATDKCVVFQNEGREYVIEDSLSTLEQQLSSHGFFRCHRAELVNLAHVRAMRTVDGVTRVGLSDGQAADVSRRELPALRRKLGL